MRKEHLLLRALCVCACSLVCAVAAWPVLADELPCADTVRATVTGNNINVYHDQAEWNCCATIVFDLEAHADTFDLYESETYEVGPCLCLCCFDLVAAITDVAPGEYLVRVLAAGTGELFGEVSVQVPEALTWPAAVRSEAPGIRMSAAETPGAAGLGGTLQSPCGGWTVDVTEPQTTWGHIKAIFR